jgi:hypothetical protein
MDSCGIGLDLSHFSAPLEFDAEMHSKAF